jgi:hypothetical protein
MGLVVSTSDFVGKWGITIPKPFVNSANPSNYLDDLINEVEGRVLLQLFGGDMYADFAATPTDPVYDTIKSPFIVYSQYCRGLKTMLIGFIFFEYYSKARTATNAGLTKVKGETTQALPSGLSLSLDYNGSVKDYNLLVQYLEANKATFPKFAPLVYRQRKITL